MKFSTRTIYGLKAVLVLAGRFGEGSLSVSQIAKKENISVAYLEQILNALKKKGFVKSVRGPQGGYVLSRKPSEIDLKTLFYTLEQNGFAPQTRSSAPDVTTIASELFWGKFREAFDAGLKGANLQRLLDDARRIQKGKSKHGSQTFHI